MILQSAPIYSGRLPLFPPSTASSIESINNTFSTPSVLPPAVRIGCSLTDPVTRIRLPINALHSVGMRVRNGVKYSVPSSERTTSRENGSFPTSRNVPVTAIGLLPRSDTDTSPSALELQRQAAARAAAVNRRFTSIAESLRRSARTRFVPQATAHGARRRSCRWHPTGIEACRVEKRRGRRQREQVAMERPRAKAQ